MLRAVSTPTSRRVAICVRFVSGAAIGGVVGASSWDTKIGIAAAVAGSLLAVAVGGRLLGTTAWATLGGAMAGWIIVGVTCVLATGHTRGVVDGALIGTPLGALVGLALGGLLEAAIDNCKTPG